MDRNRLEAAALLLLRLAGLGLALAHGWGKLVALATGQAAGFIQGVDALGFPMPAVFAWAAALSEFAGGLLVAAGLGTRIAAAFCAFTMFVAAFFRHHALGQLFAALGLSAPDPEMMASWGSPEKALVYLLCFLAVLLLGPGRFSLEHRLRGRSS